jgi:hypothetical protein
MLTLEPERLQNRLTATRKKSPEMEETSTPLPLPETKILFPHGGSSVENESLSTHEDADLFLGLVMLEPEDASTVHKKRTFLIS